MEHAKAYSRISAAHQEPQSTALHYQEEEPITPIQAKYYEQPQLPRIKEETEEDSDPSESSHGHANITLPLRPATDVVAQAKDQPSHWSISSPGSDNEPKAPACFKSPGMPGLLKYSLLCGKQSEIVYNEANGQLLERPFYFGSIDDYPADCIVRAVEARMHKGAITGLVIYYVDGFEVRYGNLDDTHQGFYLMLDPGHGEKIIACSIEEGFKDVVTFVESSITSLRLCTNRARSMAAEGVASGMKRDGVKYRDLRRFTLDPVVDNGYFKGFFGSYPVTPLDNDAGEFRGPLTALGVVWGNYPSNLASYMEGHDKGTVHKSSKASQQTDVKSEEKGDYISSATMTTERAVHILRRSKGLLSIGWSDENGSAFARVVEDAENNEADSLADRRASNAMRDRFWVEADGAISGHYRLSDQDPQVDLQQTLQPMISVIPGNKVTAISLPAADGRLCLTLWWVSPKGSVEMLIRIGECEWMQRPRSKPESTLR